MQVWLAPSRFAPHLGGIETVVAQLAQELTAAGDQVLVVTHRHPNDLSAHEVIDGHPVRRLRFEAPSRQPRASVQFVASVMSVQRELDAEAAPDVVHIHGAASQTLHLVRFARRRAIPLILTTHGEITGDANALYVRSRYARAAFRLGVRNARALTAPSSGALREAAVLAPDGAHKSYVVPNGIHPRTWSAAGAAPDSHLVMAWGRLEWQKGFDRLVAAWPHVRAQVPDAELRVAGEGSQAGSLHAKADAGVHLIGRLDHHQLVQQLRGARFAAVPSRVEAFGMSALEALAAGRLVLHAGLPAVCDVVDQYGRTADHDDPRLLAQALVDALLTAPVTVPPSAVARFSWNAVTSAYRDLYGR